MRESFTAIGLMSGTSLDGIDAALILSDGQDRVQPGPWSLTPYPDPMRDRLRRALRDPEAPHADLERDLTLAHAEAVRALLLKAGRAAAEIDVVGFHGQTVLHAPERRLTRQLGDGALLAEALGIAVVGEFRVADVAAGGQGAPLVPLYHRAITAGLERPLAVLNLGGVGNVTALGPGEDSILAFDTGPGNALIDDWVFAHAGLPFDRGGRLAARGRVDAAALAALLDHPYFNRVPPKSLDRLSFDPAPMRHLGLEDGAATLTAFTVASVVRAVPFLPGGRPRRWLVAGGGRRNLRLTASLEHALRVPVEPVEAIGFAGDALEAQAFGYLAIRSLLGLPLSLPATTAVPQPMPGGRLFLPAGCRLAAAADAGRWRGGGRLEPSLL